MKIKINRHFVVIPIALLALILRLIQINNIEPHIDSYLHMYSAFEIANGGAMTYFRNPLYTYTVSVAFFLFGDSYFSARIFGVVLGVINTIVIYFICKKEFKSIAIPIFASILYCVSYWAIDISLFVRGYIFLSLFTFLFSYFSYKAIELPNTITVKYIKLIPFNIKYILLAALVLIIGYDYHYNIVAFTIPIIIYISIMSLVTIMHFKNSKYIKQFSCLLIFMFLGLIFATIIDVGVLKLVAWIQPLQSPNISYYNLFAEQYYGMIPILFIAFIGAIFKRNTYIIYLIVSFIFILVLYVYFIDRYYTDRYISNLQIMYIIIYVFGVYVMFENLIIFIKNIFNNFDKIQYSVLSFMVSTCYLIVIGLVIYLSTMSIYSGLKIYFDYELYLYKNYESATLNTLDQIELDDKILAMSADPTLFALRKTDYSDLMGMRYRTLNEIEEYIYSNDGWVFTDIHRYNSQNEKYGYKSVKDMISNYFNYSSNYSDWHNYVFTWDSVLPTENNCNIDQTICISSESDILNVQVNLDENLVSTINETIFIDVFYIEEDKEVNVGNDMLVYTSGQLQYNIDYDFTDQKDTLFVRLRFIDDDSEWETIYNSEVVLN